MGKILPDLIVSWPKHLDYPLWRQQIHDNRHIFNKVIIVFTNMNVNKDYSEWVKATMVHDNITFAENEPVLEGADWRDIAVNKGLTKSKSEWVWFTEQDFYWNEGFWEDLEKQSESFDILAVMVEKRMHPCSILIKRSIIEEKTRKDFGVIPDVADHFYKFQEDLKGLPYYCIPSNLYNHMGGLSQNLFLMINPKNVLYFPEEFKDYLYKCLEVKVPIHKDFKGIYDAFLIREARKA